MELEQLDPAIGPFIQAQVKPLEGLNRGPVIRGSMWLQAELLFSLQSGSVEPGGLNVELKCLLSPGSS